MNKKIALALIAIASLFLVACGTEEAVETYEETVIETSAVAETKDAQAESATSETVITSETAVIEPEVKNDGLSEEFKAAMDSYEAFFDEYVAFMKKYSESNNALEMIGEYTEYLSKYTETMEKMNQIAGSTLSTEEALYYAQVNARISEKLLSITQ